MRGRFRIRGGVLLLAVFLTLLPFTSVSGQANRTPGQGLEISPPLIELKTDPGATLDTTISIRNITEGTLIAKPEVNDFASNGVDGLPKLLLDEGEESPYSIIDWVQPIPDTRLAKGEQAQIKVRINVPKKASPGAHFGVIRFTGVPPELEDTGVSLSASLGSLVFISVSGNAKESASIQEIYTSQNNNRGGFFEQGPVTITEVVKNNGNVFLRPSGNVQVTNMFGKQVASFKLNEAGGLVLPGSTREFSQELKKGGLFGKYTVQVDMVYGAKNKIVTEKATFWIIPYKLIGLVIIGLIILFFGIRQYNRYIVSKARGGRARGKSKRRR